MPLRELLVDIITRVRDDAGAACRPLLLCVPAQFTARAHKFNNAQEACAWLLKAFPQDCVRNLQIRDIDTTLFNLQFGGPRGENTLQQVRDILLAENPN